MTKTTVLTEAQKQLKKAQQESLKQSFLTLWRQLGGPELVTEYQFHPTRDWAIDFVCIRPGLKVGIEVEGGTWVNGRHSRGKGYRDDCIKYNSATSMDWRVFRLTSDMLTQREGPEHLEPIIKLIRERG